MEVTETTYGLHDAPLQLFLDWLDHLVQCGFRQSSLEPALFYYYESEQLIRVVCLHVDDVFDTGTRKFQMEVMPKIRTRFKPSSEDEKKFKYLGFFLNQSEDRSQIKVDMNDYLKKIEEQEENSRGC